jgi:hypothetical protein
MRAPASDTPRFDSMSRTRPTPSVLSPKIRPSASMRSVFTAPAAAARGDSVSASACASSLNGTVTLAPRPPSATNARTAASKPSTGASRCS